MNRRSSKIGIVKGNAGFSLVEIMVALLISLFILGGAVTILIQNQQNYRQNDDFGRLQENARFALDLITSDLRMAGFFGCVRNNSLVPNDPLNKIFNRIAGVVAGSGSLLDTTFGLDGFEQDTGAWDAQGSTEIVNTILAGTDAITIRKLRNSGVPIVASLATPVTAIGVQSTASPVAAREPAAIYNCSATDIFMASAVVPGDPVTTIVHGVDANTSDSFSIAYLQNAAHAANPAADPTGLMAQTFVAPFDAVRYYIALSDGVPTLWRQFYDAALGVTQMPVVEGIENMQLLFGENTTPGGEPNTFVNANLVNDWNRVVAVRITLLIRTADQYGNEDDSETYDIYSTPDDDSDDIQPGGRYTRKLVSATVMLRNLQTKLGS